MKPLTLLSYCGLGLAVVLISGGLAQADNSEIFDLDELEVIGREAEQPDLVFKVESPQLAYYTPPKLPKGEVILALDFIDRYKDAPVPGPAKWAAIISFPWIDGRQQRFVEWLCLYLWDDRVYGFSPTAKFERNMRFAIPISVARKTDPEVLYALAENFVEEISPADVEMIYIENLSDSLDAFSAGNITGSDPAATDGFSDQMLEAMITYEVEYIDIPAGRIEGWRPMDKGKRKEELVSLVYVYEKDPNPDQVVSGAMGPDEQYKEANSFWKKNFTFDFSRSPDPFEIARELLKPRWSIRAILHYEKDVLFFKDVDHKAEVLLFNVGRPIFAYHPRYGVWRTDATMDMIAEGRGSDMITYPGVEKPMRVQLRMWNGTPE